MNAFHLVTHKSIYTSVVLSLLFFGDFLIESRMAFVLIYVIKWHAMIDCIILLFYY